MCYGYGPLVNTTLDPLEANPTLGPISGGVTALTGHGKLSRRVCVARPTRGERRAPIPAELGARQTGPWVGSGPIWGRSV